MFDASTQDEQNPRIPPTLAAHETLRLGHWTELQPLATPLRTAVFVHEQGVPAQLELDDEDAAAVHAVIVNDQGQTLATGRLLQDPWKGGASTSTAPTMDDSRRTIGRIGRMAVAATERGRGLGEIVLDALLAAAQARGDVGVHLHAQLSAVGFYTKKGFAPEGAVYQEAGIAHQDMRLMF